VNSVPFCKGCDAVDPSTMSFSSKMKVTATRERIVLGVRNRTDGMDGMERIDFYRSGR
jgi:hypothetical protein